MLTGPDLLEAGIYTIPEVADLVDAPQSAVRVWVEGHTGKQVPVIENQLGRVGGKTAVSFANLMELRFIARFAKAGVGLREIRNIMHEASEFLNHPHPFATHVIFKTDGRKIVAEIARRNGLDLIYDLRSHNYEMPSVVMKSLKEDVVFDPHGEMIAMDAPARNCTERHCASKNIVWSSSSETKPHTNCNNCPSIKS